MGDRPGLSEAEREVLKALWEHGPGTVRQVNDLLGDRGRRRAYTTVLTLLQRLQAKGYAEAEAAAGGAGAHVFRATVSRDELVEQRLRDTADEFCDGSAAPLLLALVQGNQFSAEELARLRRLIDEAARRPRS
ncbi:MAG: BlaI/MecI/CopY family transcriptional regulator [Isosphaeraceae bacterium]